MLTLLTDDFREIGISERRFLRPSLPSVARRASIYRLLRCFGSSRRLGEACFVDFVARAYASKESTFLSLLSLTYRLSILPATREQQSQHPRRTGGNPRELADFAHPRFQISAKIPVNKVNSLIKRRGPSSKRSHCSPHENRQPKEGQREL
jgi:hypothetical protein